MNELPVDRAAVPTAAPRILVVDDNQDSLSLLTALLHEQRYRTQAVASGAEALTAVVAHPPDLILLAGGLPALDGHDVARRIKSAHDLPFIPIIQVTAPSELHETSAGLDQGADDYLSRPLVAGELLARVRALLRLKAAQDALHSRHAELQRLHEQLRAGEAYRENLVQMITHDLRGPLTGLLGALELIEDGSLGPLTAEQGDFVRQGLQNCQTLNDMVADLLDVYRLEAGRLELARRPVALRPLADQACVQVGAAIAGKKLLLHNHIPADFPPVIGDSGKLVRVLANLLNNAFKYTERGTITLQVLVQPDNGYSHTVADEGQPSLPGRQYAIIQVQDTGVGIPAEVRALIFRKFYRGEPGGSGRRIRGAGLGLYFARHMIEAHGGNIWVESAPSGAPGSLFCVSLPLAAAGQGEEA